MIIYYFLDKNDNEQTYKDINLCRLEAIKDGSVGKFRCSNGGEYFL